MSTRTLSLMRGLDAGVIVGGDVAELIEVARLNKVLLGFLRRIGYSGPLRAREEGLCERYLAKVAEVSRALGDLDYALFKFRKPIEHVSVDVDVLIRCEHLSRAVKRLMGAGFRVEVLEPYTVTMVRGGAIVDLYTHPSFAWIVYLDGERLLEEAEPTEVGAVGVEAKALNTKAEAIVTAAHAVYKEHLYLLADYYVIKRWLSRGAIDLARELSVEEAVQVSLRLNRQIERGLVEAPVKLKLTETAGVLARKFVRDLNFRATAINTVKLVAKKRTVRLLASRVRRRGY